MSAADFSNHPFFGLWADRDDIVNSVDYVRQEREKWRERTNCDDDTAPSSVDGQE